MSVDTAGATAGYCWLASKRWEADLEVFALELEQGRNWQQALPCLLRLLRAYGESLPVNDGNTKPYTGLSLNFGRTHPVYEILGNSVASRDEPPYAWYVRVPDLPAFVELIAPVLEARVARSIHAGHTGDVKINLYDDGIHLQFENGTITSVAPWQKPAYSDDGICGCPPLVFLKLLFGYRSLAELRTMFPDVWTTPEGESLVNTLFPAQPSVVSSLNYI
ncbi:MAG: hypothetical protein IPK16_22125 [Anaerolineales bacterium]|nr:hypothetical protein [Anaerolineales bacterium]